MTDSGNEIVAAPQGVPAPPPVNSAPGSTPPAVLLAIGALQVTATHVYTPAGRIALSSSHVTFVDQTRTTSKIPTWAIVLTIITVWFFFIGLLFLLVREHSTEGYVSITVQDRDGRAYTEHILAASPQHRDQIIAQAQWLQQIASTAAWRGSSN